MGDWDVILETHLSPTPLTRLEIVSSDNEGSQPNTPVRRVVKVGGM